MNGNNKATWIRFTFFISLGVERRAFTSRSSGCLMFWVITSSLATGILITMPAFTPFFSSGLSLKSSALEISNFRQIRYMVSFFCMVYSISFCTVFFSVVGKVSSRVGGIRIFLPIVKVDVERPGLAAIISVAGTEYLMDKEYKVSFGWIVWYV